MGWTIDEIPDLSGLVSVVPEPQCPRGESTVRNLLLNNAHVVLVGAGGFSRPIHGGGAYAGWRSCRLPQTRRPATMSGHPWAIAS